MFRQGNRPDVINDAARHRSRAQACDISSRGPLLPWIGTSVSVAQCAQPCLAHQQPLHGLARLGPGGGWHLAGFGYKQAAAHTRPRLKPHPRRCVKPSRRRSQSFAILSARYTENCLSASPWIRRAVQSYFAGTSRGRGKIGITCSSCPPWRV